MNTRDLDRSWRATAGWQRSMQRVDRALLDVLPAAGRLCWETVLVLER